MFSFVIYLLKIICPRNSCETDIEVQMYDLNCEIVKINSVYSGRKVIQLEYLTNIYKPCHK